ncbi:MAG: hypothetical protein WC717_01515 [Candidatus Micrarchaeia archaeon]|jgi:hypothetical protein
MAILAKADVRENILRIIPGHSRKMDVRLFLKLAMASADPIKAQECRAEASQRMLPPAKSMLLTPVVANLPLHNTGMSNFFFSKMEDATAHKLQKIEERAFSRQFVHDLDRLERLDSAAKDPRNRDLLAGKENTLSRRELAQQALECAQEISQKYAGIRESDVLRFVAHHIRAGKRALIATSIALATLGIGVLVAQFVFKVPGLRLMGYMLPVAAVFLAAAVPAICPKEKDFGTIVESYQKLLDGARERAQKAHDSKPGVN